MTEIFGTSWSSWLKEGRFVLKEPLGSRKAEIGREGKEDQARRERRRSQVLVAGGTLVAALLVYVRNACDEVNGNGITQLIVVVDSM